MSTRNTPITQVIAECLKARRAEQYSPRTVGSYRDIYRVFVNYLEDDPPMSNIDTNTIRCFFADRENITRKTALNYHSALSSLWEWGMNNSYCEENVIRKSMKIRHPNPPEVIPFTRNEIYDLRSSARESDLPTRDEAILLLLLDTGIRATELCELRKQNIYWSSRKIRVVNGKGNKERALKFSDRTGAALMAYLKAHSLSPKGEGHLFLTENGKPLNRNTLRKLIDRLSKHSGVVHAHAHRFRHTFAIQFLRNGGNIYTLQKLLGHTTLDMCKRYLAIAQIDMDEGLDKASPVKCWGL